MAVTVKDIAGELNLSVPTVVQVLAQRGRISAKTRARVLETASRLGYRPHTAARVMRSKHTGQVGVLIHDAGGKPIGKPHTLEFITGINDVLEPAGYTTTLVQMSDVERDLDGVGRVFREQMLDGMIVQAALVEAVRQQIGELMQRVIWCDAGVHEAETCLWRNEFKAGQLVAHAVAQTNYRDWLVSMEVSPANRPYQHNQSRLQGIMSIANQVGASIAQLASTSVWDAVIIPGLRERLRPGMAVIAGDYEQVFVIAATAMELGLRPGHDFGLACCDEVLNLKRTWPQLARCTYNRFEMGKRAAEMMLHRLREPEKPCPSYIDQPVWISGTTLSLTV